MRRAEEMRREDEIDKILGDKAVQEEWKRRGK